MSTTGGSRTARPGLLVLLVLAVAVAAVVAAWLTGRLPGASTATVAAMTVRDGAPPLLDCNGGPTAGGPVQPGGPVAEADVPAVATVERDAWVQAAILTRLDGYRAGQDLVVVWSDAASRPRLVLSFRAVTDGYTLTSRSGCA